VTTVIVLSICVALHTTATAILLGQYLLMALVILPVLQARLDLPARTKMVAGIMKQARPWVLAALAVFIVTGFLMLVLNPSYLGFMDISNAWSILMYSKHILVFGLIVLGVYLDRGISQKMESARGEEAGGLLQRFRTVNGLMILGGLAILSLTALAQSL
jgi:uncharacterized membrane protein